MAGIGTAHVQLVLQLKLRDGDMTPSERLTKEADLSTRRMASFCASALQRDVLPARHTFRHAYPTSKVRLAFCTHQHGNNTILTAGPQQDRCVCVLRRFQTICQPLPVEGFFLDLRQVAPAICAQKCLCRDGSRERLYGGGGGQPSSGSLYGEVANVMRQLARCRVAQVKLVS